MTLKVWNKEVYGWLDLKIVERIDEQHDLDNFLISNAGGDVAGAVEARRMAADDIWRKMKWKESLLRVKSGQSWLKKGDFKIKFFHNSLKERVRRNASSLLETLNGWIEGVKEVKTFIRKHYEEFFKESCNTRLVPK